MERIESLARSNWFHSPITALNTNKPKDPTSISIPVPKSDEVGRDAFRLYNEPIDQDRAASIKTTIPTGSSAGLPVWDCQGLASNAIPVRPTITPNQVIQLARPPFGRSESINTIHKGVVAMKREAIPDGMCCSAHTKPPLPPKSSRRPMMAAERHSIFLGAGAPLRRFTPYRMAPETRKRIPADRKGGMVSMVNRMARYVDPQTIKTAISDI